jgi:hypothetical protein
MPSRRSPSPNPSLSRRRPRPYLRSISSGGPRSRCISGPDTGRSDGKTRTDADHGQLATAARVRNALVLKARPGYASGRERRMARPKVRWRRVRVDARPQIVQAREVANPMRSNAGPGVASGRAVFLSTTLTPSPPWLRGRGRIEWGHRELSPAHPFRTASRATLPAAPDRRGTLGRSRPRSVSPRRPVMRTTAESTVLKARATAGTFVVVRARDIRPGHADNRQGLLGFRGRCPVLLDAGHHAVQGQGPPDRAPRSRGPITRSSRSSGRTTPRGRGGRTSTGSTVAYIESRPVAGIAVLSR